MATPTAAYACGGTFCDAGPQAIPVDQTGENVLFVMENGTVEAHIQIQYQGDPEKFAWIVPVMAVPDVEVGSDPLFQNLLSGTVPTFGLNTQFESCSGGDDSFAFGCGMAASDGAAGGSSGSGTAGLDDTGEPPGPDVVERGMAGSFEYVVLDGGSVDGLVQWLDEHGYAQDPDAPPILQEYLDEGFVFVAFKLRAGAGIEAIHPIVIRYQGDEPCVPIRLTRIAAVPDMGIRVFFLGDERVVPQNYRHVEVNQAKIDWLGLGANYNEAVTLAVDSEGSEGHGFVTEYAGPSQVVTSVGILGNWSPLLFTDLDPTDVVDELERQQLMACNGESCEYYHPMVQAVLGTYLPVPDGLSDIEFYSCLSCYEGFIDTEAWSGSGFAQALEERIVTPAEHAIDLLEAHPYLTRMFTTISAEEMTKDPLFHENGELGDVSNTQTATVVRTCEGPDELMLPDGRTLFLDDLGNQPGLEEVSWAEAVAAVPASGQMMVIADNTDDIDAAIDAWNGEQDTGGGGCGCRVPNLDLQGFAIMALVFGFLWRGRRRS